MTKQKLGMIFSGIAIAGTIVTNAVTAVRTLKYKEILEECEGNKPKAVVKTYWPSFLLGAITVGSIVGAEKANLAEIGVLAGTCSYLAQKAQNVEQLVREKAGEEAANDIHKETIRYIKLPGPSVEETGRGDLLCLEAYSGRWFRSSEESVRESVKQFINMHKNGMYVSLNDLHILLGITETRFGLEHGFPANPDYYEKILIDMDYYTMDEKYGEPVFVIDIQTSPMECREEV